MADDIKGCRSFVGMVSFVSIFCPELQKLLKPIYNNMKIYNNNLAMTSANIFNFGLNPPNIPKHPKVATKILATVQLITSKQNENGCPILLDTHFPIHHFGYNNIGKTFSSDQKKT